MSELRQILAAEFVSLTGGLLAGLMLSSIKHEIALVPGLLILLPGFLEMRGNLSGTLSARLSSALHLGTIDSLKSQITKDYIMSTIILTLLLGTSLGVIAYAANILLGLNYPNIILISIMASILSGAFMIPVTVYFVFFLFKKGYDPDNIMGPYVTTIGDIICMVSLIIAVAIL